VGNRFWNFGIMCLEFQMCLTCLYLTVNFYIFGTLQYGKHKFDSHLSIVGGYIVYTQNKKFTDKRILVTQYNFCMVDTCNI